MKSFKKGQKVWSVRGGWDTVANVAKGDWYPIKLASGSEYTLDGRFLDTDLRPTLFHDEPKDWPNLDPPCQFKVDQPLLVRNGDPQEWKLAYFAKMHQDGIHCWRYGLKSGQTGGSQYWAEYKTLEEVIGE